ncbi:MAG: hypothetical protein HRT89_02640 [Lentisphaeria bacterium]|nr:hypothetical protein [Lentisphaeria bacterium]
MVIMVRNFLLSIILLTFSAIAGEYIPVYNPNEGQLIVYNSDKEEIFKDYIGIKGKIRFVNLTDDEDEDFVFSSEFVWEGQPYTSIRVYIWYNNEFVNIINEAIATTGVDFEVGNFRGDDKRRELALSWQFDWEGADYTHTRIIELKILKVKDGKDKNVDDKHMKKYLAYLADNTEDEYRPYMKIKYECNFHEDFTIKAANFEGGDMDYLLFQHVFSWTDIIDGEEKISEWVGIDILPADVNMRDDDANEDRVNQDVVFHKQSFMIGSNVVIGDWDGNNKMDFASFINDEVGRKVDIWMHEGGSSPTEVYEYKTTLTPDKDAHITSTKYNDLDLLTIVETYEDPDSSENVYGITAYDKDFNLIYEKVAADAFLLSYDVDNDGIDEWITKYLSNYTAINLPDYDEVTDTFPSENHIILDK